MKAQSILSLALLSALTAGAFAQGSLTPPAGPPAPVFKTLDQVESRTPVNSLPGDATAVHIISLPGSYYLTGPVTGNTGKAGIRIEAVNVTLDLNGFTLEAVVGSTAGITSNAPGGPLVVRNGMIRGYTTGIDLSNSTQFLLQDIQVVAPQGTGVKLDGQGIAERVSVMNGKATGIDASATSRVQIRDCRVDGITNLAGGAAGIRAPMGDIRGCYVGNLSGPGFTGIHSTSGSVDSCTVKGISGSSTPVGISAAIVSRCVVADISNPGGQANGVSGGKTAVDTSVSGISGGTTVRGIDGVQRVVNCEVSNLTAGNSVAIGVGATDEVVNSRISGVTGGTPVNSVQIDLLANGRAVGNRLQISSSGTGIRLANNCLAEGNLITNTNGTGTGISAQASISGYRLEANHISGFNAGIDAPAADAVIVRNTVGQTTTSFTVHAGVTVVTPAAMGTNPHANVRQ